ncbi:hypothetical protein [Streptomyces sp. SID8014]|uniref:hypothetical protein n=1 Tax=Streptomyces sp. SID8014 TaxID=2706097 RepID=UPI001EF1F910|nr:hypothetical protein [Streptomyces sp. SID8014]
MREAGGPAAAPPVRERRRGIAARLFMLLAAGATASGLHWGLAVHARDGRCHRSLAVGRIDSPRFWRGRSRGHEATRAVLHVAARRREEVAAPARHRPCTNLSARHGRPGRPDTGRR